MSSVGIEYFKTAQLQNATQLGLDGKEGKTYQEKLKQKYSGDVLGLKVVASRGMQVAVKTFKSTKSAARILKEAGHQQDCAQVGTAPSVLGVSVSEKYIVMQKLDSLPVETFANEEMPEELQFAICGLMGLMDNAKVLHNDMNARNVMLDTSGRPWIIDFGLSKTITKTIIKKQGEHPNIRCTLWGLVRGFKRCKVGCAIMEQCVNANTDECIQCIEHGIQILNSFNKTRKRKR